MEKIRVTIENMKTMIKNALENIKTNKLKVFVAMVWIVLGITSVVVVSSIGNGIEQAGNYNLESEKFRMKVVDFYPNYEGEINTNLIEAFTQEDIDKISSMKGIERVSPVYGNSKGIYYGANITRDDKYDYVSFKLAKNITDLDLEYGRNFSIDDLDRKTVILQYYVANKLFNENPQNAIGQSVEMHGELFEVVGVMKQPKGGIIEQGDIYSENIAYVPEKSIKKISQQQSFGQPISQLEILIAKGYDMDEVPDKIGKLLEDMKDEKVGYYAINSTNEDNFELYYMQQTINRFTSILSNVSLLIGGIGIMNIMYMAVAERQREIGIRRAIGAEPKDILIQFVIETIVITILGGIVGIFVGSFASNYVSDYLAIKAVPSIMVYLKAIGVSIMIGVVFGSIPAYKASKLDPIKAIQG